MAKRTQVSICMEDFYAASKAGHPAFKKHEKSGKTFVSIDIWENDSPDQYGNSYSVSLYDKASKKATYIGNGKKYDANSSSNSPSNDSASDSTSDDLPY